MKTVSTRSAEETFELGRQMTESICSKRIFLLDGDLGSGKTTFTKGMAAGLDIDSDEVNSPTFTLVSQHEGRMRLYHIDLYRLDDPQDAIDHLGLLDMMSEEAIIVIEWADKLDPSWGERGVRISFGWVDETTRMITIEPQSEELSCLV